MPEVFHAAAASNYAAIGEVLPSEHGKLSLALRRPMGVITCITVYSAPGSANSKPFL